MPPLFLGCPCFSWFLVLGGSGSPPNSSGCVRLTKGVSSPCRAAIQLRGEPEETLSAHPMGAGPEMPRVAVGTSTGGTNVQILGPSARCSFTVPSLGGGFPTKIDYRKEGYPYSLLSTGGPRCTNCSLHFSGEPLQKWSEDIDLHLSDAHQRVPSETDMLKYMDISTSNLIDCMCVRVGLNMTLVAVCCFATSCP